MSKDKLLSTYNEQLNTEQNTVDISDSAIQNQEDLLKIQH